MSNENTQNLSSLPSNIIAFDNISSDNSSIARFNYYNSNDEISPEDIFEDVFDNEIDTNPENNTWRIDYFSFIENEIN